MDAFLYQCRHFTPFVIYADGLKGTKVEATMKWLAISLAIKWRKPYSWTRGYVRISVAISMMRATHRCIRVYRVPVRRIVVQRPQWKNGSRLNLCQ